MRGHRSAALASLLMPLCVGTSAPAFETRIPTGSSLLVAPLRQGELPLNVYTFRPDNCTPTGILFVFHGTNRGAKGYRDSAIAVAEKNCLLIVTPHFDRARFPNWAYHRGGLMHRDGLRPSNRWTINLVAELVTWARAAASLNDAPFILFGHSAGAQFLSRVAAYASPLPQGLTRIVLANPSTYVWPTTDVDVPYGFGGGVFDDPQQKLASYLSAPITVYVGSEDTGDKELTTNEQADAQGRNRLERAENAFREACSASKTTSAPGWKFLLAKNVGHTGRGMLLSEAVEASLGLAPGAQPCQ